MLLLAALALADVVNPSFQLGEVGEVPVGWTFPEATAAAGYRAERTGESTVLLHAKAPTAPFAALSQVLDAAPYRGQRIRLVGRVRRDAGPNGAQLWLRVDRSGAERGFFDNMQDRPVRSRAWTDVEIVGVVAEDATRIVVGLLLSGAGGMEADDLRVDVLGPAGEGDLPPAPLSARGLANLEALARLGGVVELFHPSAAPRERDWAALLARAVPSIEGAEDEEVLAARLEAVFASVAPSVEVWAGATAPPWTPPRGRLLVVEHLGLGPEWTGVEGSIYRSRLRLRPAARLAEAEEIVEVPLGGGVHARVPLALGWEARDSTLTPEAAVSTGWAPSDADRGSRLAAVMRTWSVLRHFYPYDAGVDWDEALRVALRGAAETDDLQPVLERLVAAIHDGHGHVHGPARRSHVLPLDLSAVPEGVVVARSWGDSAALRAGDLLLALDGTPVATLLDDLRARTSAATEGWATFAALGKLTTRGTAAPVMVRVQHLDGLEEEVSIQPVPFEARAANPAPRPVQGAELAPGVLYLDLTRVTEPELDELLDALAAASAVVVDMRGYPGLAAVPFLRHLADQPVQSAIWRVPDGVRPFAEPASWDESGRWRLAPLRPRLPGRIVFLVDGGVISYAESIMGIVEAEGLGTIVGTRTAGTNGNINGFEPLPGYRVTYTGMRVLKHDGSPHHGIGIVPGVVSAPTRAGIAAGVDEVLAAGVAEAAR